MSQLRNAWRDACGGCCAVMPASLLLSSMRLNTPLGSPSSRFAVLPDGADLAPLRHALQLLAPLMPAPAAAAAPTGGAAGAPSSSGAGSSAAVPLSVPQQPGQPALAAAQPARQPQRQQRERVWDPPRERNTQASLT